jgi:hypothetical protein
LGLETLEVIWIYDVGRKGVMVGKWGRGIHVTLEEPESEILWVAGTPIWSRSFHQKPQCLKELIGNSNLSMDSVKPLKTYYLGLVEWRVELGLRDLDLCPHSVCCV